MIISRDETGARRRVGGDMFSATLISYPDRDAHDVEALQAERSAAVAGDGGAGGRDGKETRRPGTPRTLTPVEVVVDDEQVEQIRDP